MGFLGKNQRVLGHWSSTPENGDVPKAARLPGVFGQRSRRCTGWDVGVSVQDLAMPVGPFQLRIIPLCHSAIILCLYFGDSLPCKTQTQMCAFCRSFSRAFSQPLLSGCGLAGAARPMLSLHRGSERWEIKEANVVGVTDQQLPAIVPPCSLCIPGLARGQARPAGISLLPTAPSISILHQLHPAGL